MGSDHERYDCFCIRSAIEFQSTPPHGERPVDAAARFPILLAMRFNPRPRMGSDPKLQSRRASRSAYRFQSTPPHGERRADTRLSATFDGRGVSIHAPAWGATRKERSTTLYYCEYVSIHAPAWGATSTSTSWSLISLWVGFNPRPRMGSDLYRSPSSTPRTI